MSPPEVETTTATPTEYEPSADGGAADINVMDALKEGWAIFAKKYGGCYWSVYCGRIVGVNIGLFDYWASIIGRPDGRGNVYIFVKSDPHAFSTAAS